MRPSQEATLSWLTIAVSVAFAWIVWPFYSAVLWAIVASMVFAPVHRKVLKSTGQRRNLAAIMTVFLLVIVVILPLIFIGAALTQEASDFYSKVQTGEVNLVSLFKHVLDGLPTWISNLLRNAGLSSLGTAQDRVSAGLAKNNPFWAAQAVNIGEWTFQFIVNLGVMLYLLFFLFRDGDAIYKRVENAIPLYFDQKEELFEKFKTVVRATVKGDLLVALLQGCLGGLIFWILAVPSPLLWTVLMTLLSLLPVIGAGIVWIPVAIYFLATGAFWQGIVLAAYGALVIGLVDNIVRPMLIGDDTKMPEYIVLIATLGGIAAFGLNGFVLGPVIAAMFIAVWDIFSARQHQIAVELDDN